MDRMIGAEPSSRPLHLRLTDFAKHGVIVCRSAAFDVDYSIAKAQSFRARIDSEGRNFMDPVAIIIMLAIGAAAGWLAGLVYSGAGFGLIGNIIVGILGAIIAGILLPNFFSFDTIVGQIVSAAIGAIILLFIIGLVGRRFA
jgi:uncharacterized membrane protein YeaQ/YmgE (transglycosylase-associated protein family)